MSYADYMNEYIEVCYSLLVFLSRYIPLSFHILGQQLFLPGCAHSQALALCLLYLIN